MAKLICGKQLVYDAINHGLKIRVLYVLKPVQFPGSSFKIKIINKNQMDQLTNLNHQGFVAELETEFQYTSFEEIIKEQPKIILVLDHLQDPHNLGAIIRSANAAGVNHLILPKTRSVSVNETVLRTSSGGIVNMKIARVNSLQASLKKLKKEHYWIYVSALEQEAQNYSVINYNFPLVLVIGNEAKGVSKSILYEADGIIFIPLRGTVQSLNASVACGILLFEILKKL